jgi:hypothetical protein
MNFGESLGEAPHFGKIFASMRVFFLRRLHNEKA